MTLRNVWCVTLAFFFLTSSAYAFDSLITLQGIVMDRSTSLPVQNASVSAVGNLAQQDSVTDSDGYFVLKFNALVHDGQLVRFSVRKDGYLTYDKQVSTSRSGLGLETVLLAPRVPSPSPRRQQPKPENPSIYINYLRLFGAEQAPLILASMYLGGGEAYDDADPLASYHLNEGNYPPTIMRFWEKWEYKDAKPIRSRVWRELFDRQPTLRTGLHMDLLKVACLGDPVASAWTWFDPSPRGKSCGDTATGDEYVVCPNSPYSVEQVREAVQKDSLEFGFLAVIIENTSGKTLRSVQFRFREIVKSPPLEPPFEDAEKVENALSTQTEQELTMPELGAGQSVLWLLAIYRKDSKGFPASYVSSVTRPTDVEFDLDGKRVSVNIRKPLLDKAATVAVPFGWYQQ